MPRPSLWECVRIYRHVLLILMATLHAIPALPSNSSPTIYSDMHPTPDFQTVFPLQQSAILRSKTCPVILLQSRSRTHPVCAVDALPPVRVPATRVPSTRLTRVQVSEALGAEESSVAEQVDKVTSLHFQQAINCCGLTSVAYALSAIGCPTKVDDLFLEVGVDVESAVGDGMTLAEIYDGSLRYINRTGIKAFVECYHFDEYIASEEGFRSACDADAEGGVDDIVVLNFHSGIAHGWEKGGGGHFSVLTAISPNSKDVIMADVHGIKYGTFWSTPIKQMYSAMAAKDSCGRARGALRFGRTDKGLKRPLTGLTPTLLDWTSPPSPFRSNYLQKYIPSKWDEGIGVRNMAGTSALANAMRLLEGDDAGIARLDEIMRELGESYTKHLNKFLTAEDIAVMTKKLREKRLTRARAKVKGVPSCSGKSLLSTLKEVGCGEDGVAVLASYDFNEAFGSPLLTRESGEAGALCHGTNSWSLIADVNTESDATDTGAVVIAPAHNVILAGRLWTTSSHRLAVAMRALNGFECKIVVLDSR